MRGKLLTSYTGTAPSASTSSALNGLSCAGMATVLPRRSAKLPCSPKLALPNPNTGLASAAASAAASVGGGAASAI